MAPKRRVNPALLRQLHAYVSVFVAPTLIFFALTGALQNFRIPDRADAPVVVQKLARVHRDAVFTANPPKKAPPAAEEPAAEKPKPKAKASTLAVKWFFTLASVAIIVSACVGLWMAFAYGRRKMVMLLLLVGGAALPLWLLSL